MNPEENRRPDASAPMGDVPVETPGIAEARREAAYGAIPDTGTAPHHEESTADTAKARGSEMAETAADEAKNVGGTALEEGRHLTDEAKSEIRHVAEEAREQLREHASVQAEKVSDSLRRFSDEFSALANGHPEEAGQLAGYADTAAEEIRHIAARMHNDGFDGILNDTRRFARERPALFLSAAAVAGFAAGRLLRGGQEIRKEHQESEETPWR
jgi:hypothetical protein